MAESRPLESSVRCGRVWAQILLPLHSIRVEPTDEDAARGISRPPGASIGHDEPAQVKAGCADEKLSRQAFALR